MPLPPRGEDLTVEQAKQRFRFMAGRRSVVPPVFGLVPRTPTLALLAGILLGARPRAAMLAAAAKLVKAIL